MTSGLYFQERKEIEEEERKEKASKKKNGKAVKRSEGGKKVIRKRVNIF